jgi:hypothetical protein
LAWKPAKRIKTKLNNQILVAAIELSFRSTSREALNHSRMMRVRITSLEQFGEHHRTEEKPDGS